MEEDEEEEGKKKRNRYDVEDLEEGVEEEQTLSEDAKEGSSVWLLCEAVMTVEKRGAGSEMERWNKRRSRKKINLTRDRCIYHTHNIYHLKL